MSTDQAHPSAAVPAEATPPSDAQLSGRRKFLGAMFLMATSAIGPGFITQTTTFTNQLAAAFAFAIAVSILVDIAIQLNVWRVIGGSGRRAQDLANSVLPGAGYLLAALDVVGGLVFNIGNIAGTSLGLNAIFGLDVRVGGAISAAVAIGIFLVRQAGVAMDRVVILLGIVGSFIGGLIGSLGLSLLELGALSGLRSWLMTDARRWGLDVELVDTSDLEAVRARLARAASRASRRPSAVSSRARGRPSQA